MNNKNVLRYLMFACLTGAILLTATACSKSPQRRYYTLSYPGIEQDSAQPPTPMYQANLRITRFTIAEPYNRPQLVYRQSPYEFQYYGFRYWVAKPQKMLRDIVHEHIRNVGLFSTVEFEYGDTDFDYELSAEIDAIEEYDVGSDWFAHLSMKFELTRVSDKKVIWRYQFDRRRKTEKRTPVFVIKALSEILTSEMDIISAGIDAAMAGERGGTPTLSCPAVVDDELPVLESFPEESEDTIRQERPVE